MNFLKLFINKIEYNII